MTSLSMYRGDDRVLTITADESLAGSSLEFTARRRFGAPDVVISKTTGSGIEIGDPDTTATVTLDAADTDDLDPCVLVWDLEVVDATAKMHTVAAGILVILADVTRTAAS